MATETRCTYLSETFPDAKVIRSVFKGHPYSGRDAMGYGRKIPTDYMVLLNNRKYRVYCCCFSNAGTCYIDTKTHKFVVVLNSDIPCEVKP
jgi:hypothetical protein